MDLLANAIAGTLPRWMRDAAGLHVRAPAAARCVAAALLGWSWSQGYVIACLAPLVVVVWWQAESRWEAGVVGSLYQLAATFDLAGPAARYLNVSAVEAAVTLAVASSCVGAAWALPWVSPSEVRVARAALSWVAWLVLTICPLGLGALMVAHPLLVAGWWLPGTGWLGLAAVALLLGLSRSVRVAPVCVALALAAIVRGPVQLPAVDIATANTAVSPPSGRQDYGSHFVVARNAMGAAGRLETPIVVLPEGAAGAWTAPMEALWLPFTSRLREAHRHAIVGATLERADGRLDNVAVILGGTDSQIVSQRLPIPYVMWRPWTHESFAAHPWESGVAIVGDRRIGILICWEAGLVLPALLSLADGAEALAVLANHWWLPPSAARGVLAAEALGALFSVPVVVARNLGGNDA